VTDARTRSILERHGLRCTRQRAEIYHALVSTSSHPTAEELFGMVRNRLPGLSLATVYNTLDAFVRRGLARKFALPPSVGEDPSASAPAPAARYDADTSEHIHLISDHGKVRDVPPDLGRRLIDGLPPDVLDELERRMGVSIDQVRIEISGTSTGRSC
jgi:Fe2+ or Zn2+ uptake regulation protein